MHHGISLIDVMTPVWIDNSGASDIRQERDTLVIVVEVDHDDLRVNAARTTSANS